MKHSKLLIVLLIASFLFSQHLYAYKIPGSKSSNSSTSGKSASAGCPVPSAKTYLELNNVRAMILTAGDMWWDIDDAQYEVPKGSRKHALFAGAIWVGGVDVNGQLRIAAQKHRQGPIPSPAGCCTDYWPGPLITSGENIATVSQDVCIEYDKHHRVTRAEVEEFRSWFNADNETKTRDFPDYAPPKSITDYPGNGDFINGYPQYLAPFKDIDGDGIYNYNYGDYPFYDLDQEKPCNTIPERRADSLTGTTQILYGDETLWWIYNDKGNIHSETEGGAAIGMEFRAQAFAFSTNDELNNMTFYNYQIVNRSTFELTDAYFGVWTDSDIGYAWDDYVQTDVNRGLGIVYNGDDIDGTGQVTDYGENPPAIGVDFFEGPYMDPDGIDNPSHWGPDGQLDCNVAYIHYYDSVADEDVWYSNLDSASVIPDIYNGNINGLNFGDGIADNERWGMRRFLYFNNTDIDAKTDPHTAIEHYNYIKGIWKDGIRLTYGGTGYRADGTGQVADFMMPSNTDPCLWSTGGVDPEYEPPDGSDEGWTEKAEGNESGDRRIVQSAGPFTLQPGAVNYITLGVVWARATSGGAYQAVYEVVKADDKAQKLFENCFRIVDGPDAPDMDIVEMDQELLFHLYYKNPKSNNYLEDYEEQDPYIPERKIIDADSVLIFDRYFHFQGYQVFQLKSATVTTGELENPDAARLAFQCDIRDGVSQIINYTWSDELQANLPVEKVNGSDNGIRHTFRATEDLFASENKTLVNHKKYYYLVVAYAYNDMVDQNGYSHLYDQTDPNAVFDSQKEPYKAGRKNIKIYEAIPHKNTFVGEDAGIIIRSSYGTEPPIIRIEGHGNGDNNLVLSDETVDHILEGGMMVNGEPTWKAETAIYQSGAGPLTVKVIDPLNIVADNFFIKFTNTVFDIDENPFNPAEFKLVEGFIESSDWMIIRESTLDTINSLRGICTPYNNEQLFVNEGWGFSIDIQQVDYVLQKSDNYTNIINHSTNGYITASVEFANPEFPWLAFIPDADDASAYNWIRSGQIEDPSDWTDYDNSQVYERVLEGTWAPYRLVSRDEHGPMARNTSSSSEDLIVTGLEGQLAYKHLVPSVMVVITKDKSNWTRCPVIELSESKFLAENNALPFTLRKSPSLNKEGTPASQTDVDNNTISDNPDDPNYISPYGYSWFPGYAIDMGTGERLNMMFGEASWLVGSNGRDMLWNPTAETINDVSPLPDDEQVLFGGKHYIYVVGHHINYSSMTRYDAGQYLKELFDLDEKDYYKQIWASPSWVSIPLIREEYQFDTYQEFIDNDSIDDVTIRISIANPYCKSIDDHQLVDDAAALNENLPMFSFNTTSLQPEKQVLEEAKNALDLIRVVPNPYYGSSEYEMQQLDNLVKITNLPRECTVTVYSINGTLIRRFSKDNELTYIDWDLTNNYDIPISSGVYIIHINAPDIGEKIIKWFGSMRPLDLNAF